MTADTVLVQVPPKAGHLALLRTAVGGFAARDHFTLDQVDDLRMAVEEAAVQLLRHNRGEQLSLSITGTDTGLEVRLSAVVADPTAVIDRSSFSWTILQALADAIDLEVDPPLATVVLRKQRLLTVSEQGDA